MMVTAEQLHRAVNAMVHQCDAVVVPESLVVYGQMTQQELKQFLFTTPYVRSVRFVRPDGKPW